jgi:Fic family protein
MTMNSWEHKQWPNYQFDRDSIKPLIDEYHAKKADLDNALLEANAKDKAEISIDGKINNATYNAVIDDYGVSECKLEAAFIMNTGVNNTELDLEPLSKKEEGIAFVELQSTENVSDTLSVDLLNTMNKRLLRFAEDQLYGTKEIGHLRVTTKATYAGMVNGKPDYFVAPDPKNVPHEMNRFIEWFNDSKDNENISSIERAGLAHLWFETIHPYTEGNGIIGRSISQMAISQREGNESAISLSPAIHEDRIAYFQQLYKGSKTIEATEWMGWFAKTAIRGAEISLDRTNHIIGKNRFWEQNADKDLNPRQAKAIEYLLYIDNDVQEMTAKTYMSINDCSKATATRDLTELDQIDCMTQHGKGRSVHYEINIPKPVQENAVNLSNLDLKNATTRDANQQTNTQTRTR